MPRGEVRITRGARQAEGELLARLVEAAEEARREPALLARPVRVVVPSRSLRQHVAAALVARVGAPVAGVAVQTLFGLACEVLERAGEPVPRGRPLFALVVTRLARSEAALRRGLEGLADGYGVVAGTVRDLLDAGLEPAHAEAAAELLASDGLQAGSQAQVERALAVVRVAARVEAALEELGIGPFAAVLRRASELLATAVVEPVVPLSTAAAVSPAAASPAALDVLLPARAVWIHGFADATGLASDLIEALLRRRGARLVLDWPPQPCSLQPAVESAFTNRLFERLAGFGHSPARAREVASPRVGGFHAVGADAEVRELAQRVAALLAGGARAERIGVVARDFAPYRLALRRHFWRLGVPFSALGERGPLTPAGRLANALLELLGRGEEMPADRFLDLVESLPAGPRIDLRLAFFALGAGRLRDLAELDPGRFKAGFALPIRVGLRGSPGGGGRGEGFDGAGAHALDGLDGLDALDAVDAADAAEAAEAAEAGADLTGVGEAEASAAEAGVAAYAVRRRVSGGRIGAALRVAARVRARLAAWPEVAAGAARLRELAVMLEEDLGWRRDGARGWPVFAALGELAGELPPRLALRLDELQQLLGAALAETAEVDLGGCGGGVQVLTAMEARGRTFDHLFVIGLNRDLFPRPVREDPVLPDALRKVLRRLLPDVPLKRGGFDEERYLFAQLLSAAPEVTLSWRVADEDGRPLATSPLVERLGDAVAAVAAAPGLHAAPGGGAAARRPRPADEEAVVAALHATRSHFAGVLPAACREVRGELLPAAVARWSPLASEELAAARLRILDEADPDSRTAAGRAAARRLGPYFGFIGPLAGVAGGEPRRRDLYVTHLEGLAGCPWQHFVTRLLRVQPTPDPLGALPGLDTLLLGNLVHAVLDRMVAARVEAPARAPVPVPVPWPEEAELEPLLHAEAERLLAEQGVALPGLVRSLVERARPYLQAARAADWEPHGGVLPVVESEVERQIAMRDGAGTERPLRFRADRLDLDAGVPRWTDYKVGRPFSAAKKAETRRRALLQRVREGVNLQGVAYTRAPAPGGPGGTARGVGRYLFLRPDLAAEQREVLATAGDEELGAAFEAAGRAVLEAWDQGSFFPRLVDGGGRDEPARCSYCTVAEACLRGDSAARHRLVAWTRQAAAGGEDGPTAALLALWRLGQA
jgi:hypothetical protein